MSKTSMAGNAHSDYAAFDSLAVDYDRTFTRTLVGEAQREAVWLEMDPYFRPGDRILEINCGTGVDAIHLAKRDIEVVACDASREMIRVARLNAQEAGVQRRTEFIELKTEDIFLLGKNFQFDGLLSNFGGLNCVADLQYIARDLAPLLKQGSKVLICAFGTFCAWEILWHLAKGNPAKAFRRLRSRSEVHLVSGGSIPVYRHSTRRIRSDFEPYFRLQLRRGVGIAVPPSYVNGLAERIPRAMSAMKAIDRLISKWPFCRGMADHNLMVFERTEVCPQ